MEELKINPEFHNLIPLISSEEYQLLEESILQEGCREAIITWNDQILDGHNRYEICQKNEIKFKTIEKSFDNEDEAKIWIIQNQLARRNLPPYERTRLVLVLEPLIAEKGKEQQKRKPESVLQISVEQKIDTQKELAKAAGVSHDTVHKVKTIEEKAPQEIKHRARRGEISINEAYKKTTEKIKEKKNPPKQKDDEKTEPKESEALIALKRWWSVAIKKDQKTFLAWIKQTN